MTPLDVTSTTPTSLMRQVEKEGTLFFDSVGNFPKNYKTPHSILAVQPSEIFRGHISDVKELEVLMSEHTDTASHEYPTGGLAGWVDFEGNYTFGLYEKFWVYSHHEGLWLQEGKSLPFKKEEKSQVSLSDWHASVSRSEFKEMVKAAHEYIAQGNIYQVNLAHQFWAEITSNEDVYALYESLRVNSPAPMACYGNLGRRELICSSPETFLRLSGDRIETRPIKGTSPRFREEEKDLLSARELMSSEKEKAELLMITDLLRNDLGRICKYGSVSVDELLSLEQLEHVYHMVSTVKGQLRPHISHVQALSECLPGGSITGAPKLSALKVIEELETTKRGLYTGVVGYLGFNGESQFNIAIRSLVREGEKLHYHVGAGIVADSDPDKEYEETLVKAEGIRRALGCFSQ